MARVLITGSSDGLGLMAGRLLAAQGHAVVLHARNKSRAEDAQAELRQSELAQTAGVITGDLAGLAGMRLLLPLAAAGDPSRDPRRDGPG